MSVEQPADQAETQGKRVAERMRKDIVVRTEGQAQISLGLAITQLRMDGFGPDEILVVSHRGTDSLVHRTQEVVPELAEVLLPLAGHEEERDQIRYASFAEIGDTPWPALLITDAYDLDKGVEVDLFVREHVEGLAQQSLVTITLDPEDKPSGPSLDLDV